MQDAQRCGRGVSAILSEKWRLNSSCRSERRPSGPRKMAVADGGPWSFMCFKITLARFGLAVDRYREPRCPCLQPGLRRSSRSFLLSSPLSSPSSPPPCLFGKPARRMRVTIALVSAYETENIQDSLNVFTRRVHVSAQARDVISH